MSLVRITTRSIVLAAAFAAVAVLAQIDLAGADTGDPAVEIVVKVEPGVDPTTLSEERDIDLIESVLASRGIYLLAVEALPGEDHDKALKEATKDLEKADGVIYAEPNHDAEVTDVDRFHHWDSVEPSFVGTDPRLRTDQDVVSQLGLPSLRQFVTGAGITVAVLDTGADLDHPDLVRNLLPGYDYVDDDAAPDDIANGLDDDGDGRIDEGAGHGSHVSGLVTLVAPDARILPLRVLDSDGTGSVFVTAEAIIDAVAAGADVINLSFGYESEIESEVLEEALKIARKAEVVIVAAAGNDASSDEQYPAASKDVLSVGAVDTASTSAAGYTNRGKWVTVGAPGVDLISTVPGGYARASGTSMSAPIVAGEVALLKQLDPHKMRKAKDVRNAVRKAARALDVAKELDPRFAAVDFAMIALPDLPPPPIVAPTPAAPTEPEPPSPASSAESVDDETVDNTQPEPPTADDPPADEPPVDEPPAGGAEPEPAAGTAQVEPEPPAS